MPALPPFSISRSLSVSLSDFLPLCLCLSVWLAGWLAGCLSVCLSVCLPPQQVRKAHKELEDNISNATEVGAGSLMLKGSCRIKRCSWQVHIKSINAQLEGAAVAESKEPHRTRYSFWSRAKKCSGGYRNKRRACPFGVGLPTTRKRRRLNLSRNLRGEWSRREPWGLDSRRAGATLNNSDWMHGSMT